MGEVTRSCLPWAMTTYGAPEILGGLVPAQVAAFSATTLGVGKPDPRMFQVGARAAGASPEAVLHIGDDAHLDGVGALNAGMQMAWVNRGGHAWEHPVHAPHVTVAELRSLCELLS